MVDCTQGPFFVLYPERYTFSSYLILSFRSLLFHCTEPHPALPGMIYCMHWRTIAWYEARFEISIYIIICITCIDIQSRSRCPGAAPRPHRGTAPGRASAAQAQAHVARAAPGIDDVLISLESEQSSVQLPSLVCRQDYSPLRLILCVYLYLHLWVGWGETGFLEYCFLFFHNCSTSPSISITTIAIHSLNSLSLCPNNSGVLSSAQFALWNGSSHMPTPLIYPDLIEMYISLLLCIFLSQSYPCICLPEVKILYHFRLLLPLTSHQSWSFDSPLTLNFPVIAGIHFSQSSASYSYSPFEFITITMHP